MQFLRNLLPAVPSSCVDEPPPTAFAQLLASSFLPATGLADADSSSESSSSSLEYADEPAQPRSHVDDWHELYAPPSPRSPMDSPVTPDIPTLDADPQHAMALAELFDQPFPGEIDAHDNRPTSPQLPPPVRGSVKPSVLDRCSLSLQAAPSTVTFSALEGRVQTVRVSITFYLLARPARISAYVVRTDQRIGGYLLVAPAP